MNQLPSSIPELIEMLDKNYRWTNPKLEESDRSIWKRIGQRELIDSLKSKLEVDNIESGLPKATAKGTTHVS